MAVTIPKVLHYVTKYILSQFSPHFNLLLHACQFFNESEVLCTRVEYAAEQSKDTKSARKRKRKRTLSLKKFAATVMPQRKERSIQGNGTPRLVRTCLIIAIDSTTVLLFMLLQRRMPAPPVFYSSMQFFFLHRCVQTNVHLVYTRRQ